MFRALLAHPHEALHKRHLVHVCYSQLELYAHSIPNAVCVASPEDDQVMLETFKSL
jgi:hypothetical protein